MSVDRQEWLDMHHVEEKKKELSDAENYIFSNVYLFLFLARH